MFITMTISPLTYHSVVQLSPEIEASALLVAKTTRENVNIKDQCFGKLCKIRRIN